MMEKKHYVSPQICFVECFAEDVIANSGELIFPIRPMSLDPADDVECS